LSSLAGPPGAEWKGVRQFLLRYHGTDLRLTEGTTLFIGRDATCDICIDDDLASRRHAQVTVREEFVEITDLGSRNGVFVNGAAITAARRLDSGDWFRVGRSEFGLRLLLIDRASAGKPTGEHPWPSAAASNPLKGTGGAGGVVNPIDSVRASGRKLLTDRTLVVLDRVKGALHLVEVLVQMQAPAQATELLGETLDTLAIEEASGILPPATSAVARAFAARWSEALMGSTADEAARWQRRLEALSRAERNR
jgi:hypothetical protein